MGGIYGTYGNAAQDLRDEERLDVLGSEEYSREAHQQSQTADDGPSVAKSLRDPTVDEQSDDGTDIGTVTQARLPCCRDLVRAINLELAVLLSPLSETIQTVDQSKIKALHCDTGRDQK